MTGTKEIEEELYRLPNLYELTGRDWEIKIMNVFTEIGDPIVIIQERLDYETGEPRCSFVFHGNTYLKAVREAVDHILENLDGIKAKCPKREDE